MDKKAEIYEPVLLQAYRILEGFQRRIDVMRVERQDSIELERLLQQALQAVKTLDVKITSIVTRGV